MLWINKYSKYRTEQHKSKSIDYFLEVFGQDLKKPEYLDKVKQVLVLDPDKSFIAERIGQNLAGVKIEIISDSEQKPNRNTYDLIIAAYPARMDSNQVASTAAIFTQTNGLVMIITQEKELLDRSTSRDTVEEISIAGFNPIDITNIKNNGRKSFGYLGFKPNQINHSQMQYS